MADLNYFAYLLASQSRNPDCGVTNSIDRRVIEQRSGAGKGFAATYKCNRLVSFKRFKYVDNAIAREKQIKRWRREKKLRLINAANPAWTDLADGLQDALRFGRDDKP
jgi:putative endonuclease